MAKKITAIISLTIIAILVAATVIMANIPVSHNIKYSTPDVIEIYYGGTEKTSQPVDKTQDRDKFNKILNYIDNSCKENALTAMFNGRLGQTPSVLTGANETKLNTIQSNTDSIYVSFVYTENQTLMDGNKPFKDENNKNYLYKQICFELTKDSDIVKAYVIPAYDDSNKEYRHGNNSKLQYHKYFEIETNLTDLYDYLSDLK